MHIQSVQNVDYYKQYLKGPFGIYSKPKHNSIKYLFQTYIDSYKYYVIQKIIKSPINLLL
jgi:hypothetical protein